MFDRMVIRDGKVGGWLTGWGGHKRRGRGANKEGRIEASLRPSPRQGKSMARQGENMADRSKAEVMTLGCGFVHASEEKHMGRGNLLTVGDLEVEKVGRGGHRCKVVMCWTRV